MNNKKISCVVVTYNRLDLLKECIDAVKKQTCPVDCLWIIDNCSTDGTTEWLDTLKGDGNTSLHVVHTEKNVGGAGGFSLGTKLAVEDGCDYIWLMDDDTIAQPDALAHLVAATEGGNTGFVCSKVLWTDGNVHAMNKAGAAKEKIDINGEACYSCHQCTFVSMLVSSKAVYEVGLPIKEFFIWCDDIEYSNRIYQAKYDCYYVPESVVYHKTRLNYFPSVEKAPKEMAGRFYYQVRNTCYLKRKKTGRIILYLSVLNKYRLYLHKLGNRKDKSNYKEFKKAIFRGCIDGMRFNPKIDFPQSK